MTDIKDIDPARARARALRGWVTRRGGAPVREVPGPQVFAARGLDPKQRVSNIVHASRVPPKSGKPGKVVSSTPKAPTGATPAPKGSYARGPSGHPSLFGPPDPKGHGHGHGGHRYTPEVPPPPPLPDPAMLAPGSGVPGGRNAPLSDPEYEARRIYATALQRSREWGPGGPHDTSRLHADRHGGWSPERTAIHDEMIQARLDAAVAAGVGFEGDGVYLGGVAGSGKSSLFAKPGKAAELRVDVDANGNPTSHVLVSNDDFKDELVARGLVDVPPGLSPMEAAYLAEDEGRYLAEQMLRAAAKRNMNVLWDGTMMNFGMDSSRMKVMQDAGYTTAIGFVDTTVPKAIEGVRNRHRQGIDDYEVRGKGLGARFVPEDYLRMSDPRGGLVDSAEGKVAPLSYNREVAQKLQDMGKVDELVVFDNRDYVGNVTYRWPPDDDAAAGAA